MAVGAVLASGEGVAVGTGGVVELGTVVKVAVGKGGRVGVGDKTEEAPRNLLAHEDPQAVVVNRSESRSKDRAFLPIEMRPSFISENR